MEIVEQQRLRKFWLNWPPTPSPEIFLCFNWEWRKERKRQIIFFLNKFFPFSLEPLRWPLFRTRTHTLSPLTNTSPLLHTFIHHPPSRSHSLTLSLGSPALTQHLTHSRTHSHSLTRTLKSFLSFRSFVAASEIDVWCSNSKSQKSFWSSAEARTLISDLSRRKKVPYKNKKVPNRCKSYQRIFIIMYFKSVW